MNDLQLVAFVFNMHTRTMTGLLDAVDRADTPMQRAERMQLARDCVSEFGTETRDMFLQTLKEKQS